MGISSGKRYTCQSPATDMLTIFRRRSLARVCLLQENSSTAR